MALLRRWLLIFFALVLGGGQLLAASGREERAFAAATATFQDQNWNRAEMEYAQFIQHFPKSSHVPAALLARSPQSVVLHAS